MPFNFLGRCSLIRGLQTPDKPCEFHLHSHFIILQVYPQPDRQAKPGPVLCKPCQTISVCKKYLPTLSPL